MVLACLVSYNLNGHSTADEQWVMVCFHMVLLFTMLLLGFLCHDALMATCENFLSLGLLACMAVYIPILATTANSFALRRSHTSFPWAVWRAPETPHSLQPSSLPDTSTFARPVGSKWYCDFNLQFPQKQKDWVSFPIFVGCSCFSKITAPTVSKIDKESV